MDKTKLSKSVVKTIAKNVFLFNKSLEDARNNVESKGGMKTFIL